MKTLLFFVSAATAAIVAGTAIVRIVDPLPVQVIYQIVLEPAEQPLSTVIEAEKLRHKLPSGLIEAVIFTESKFDEKAKNPEKSLCGKMAAKGWKKSDCQSRGLMGVVYGWHKDFCGLKSPNDLYDPATNITCGAKVLSQKLKMANGDVEKGLGFYNGDKSGQYAGKVIPLWKKFARS